MINSIINANAYRNGSTLIGKLEEIELPSVKFKTEKITALGVFGEMEFPVGLEVMEAKLKWNGIYAKDWKAGSPITTQTIVVKSNMVTQDANGQSGNSAVTASIRGVYKELPTGKVKAGAKFDGAEHSMTVNYYKLEVAGETIYEIDLYNNILIVDGKDMLESFKANQ